jgi:hypothetical protein
MGWVHPKRMPFEEFQLSGFPILIRVRVQAEQPLAERSGILELSLRTHMSDRQDVEQGD